MKKITLSLLALGAASTFAIAGGDIAPVEPVVDTPAVVPAPVGNFYGGIAYSYISEDYSRNPQGNPQNFDDSVNGLMLQAGYKFNPYISVEGRYWEGRWDTFDVKNAAGTDYTLAGPNAYGLYVKPSYPVTEAIDVYALLGYAWVDQNSVRLNSLDGFSWGLGASYTVMDNIDLFIDYTRLADEDNTVPGATKSYTVDSINFGATYNF